MRFVIATLLLICACRSSQQVQAYDDDAKLTPLMNASMHTDLPRVRNLLEHGASVSAKTADGLTALYYAIDRRPPFSDNVPVVEILLKAGADVNSVSLMGALTRDNANPKATLLLLHSGLVVPKTCGEGDSVVSLAAQGPGLEVLQAIVDRGAAVDCRDSRGRSALFWAAENCTADEVAFLLKRGTDPRIPALTFTGPGDAREDCKRTVDLLSEASRGVAGLLRRK